MRPSMPEAVRLLRRVYGALPDAAGTRFVRRATRALSSTASPLDTGAAEPSDTSPFRRRESHTTERPLVLTYPRDPNPYQELLHTALHDVGIDAAYLPERTGSAAANLLLLPVELILGRLRGVRILHLHWVFKFVPAWLARTPGGRTAGRLWFQAVLACAHALGYRIVWTAHNLLPHAPVFDDDRAARRHLVHAADAVIAHGPQVVDRLTAEHGLDPAKATVVPHGPFTPHPDAPDRDTVRAGLGIPADATLLGLVGRIDPYKGADDLLAAVARLDDADELPSDVHVLVAGSVKGDDLESRIVDLADGHARSHLHLAWLTDAEFSGLVGALDLAVLPFRRITTSGSAIAALSAGVPVAVPQDMLPDLPADATLRFTDVADLVRHLAAHPEALPTAQAAATRRAHDWTWRDVADHTAAVYRRIL